MPLNEKKLQNLAQLLPYIPPKYHKYYEEIGATTSKADEREDDFDEDQNLENLEQFSEIEADTSDDEN